jgi:hypothetical protein
LGGCLCDRAATEAAEGASALEAQIEEAMEHKEEAQRRFDELNQQKHHLSSVTKPPLYPRNKVVPVYNP